MSDRSAKLLLRYAEAIEQSMKTAPHLKMAGVRSVPADVGLVSETLDWARGYRQHVKTIMRKRSALHDAECSDISDPVKFYNDGRMRTLQLKRIGNEAARRAFVDGFPLESVQGEPVRETDFVSIEQICKMLDAGKAYLDDVFNEDDDVTITKGAEPLPTVTPAVESDAAYGNTTSQCSISAVVAKDKTWCRVVCSSPWEISPSDMTFAFMEAMNECIRVHGPTGPEVCKWHVINPRVPKAGDPMGITGGVCWVLK